MKYCAAIFSIIIFSSIIADDVITGLNKEFYARLVKLHGIERDSYIDTLLNAKVTGNGKIVSVMENDRYRKRFKIKLVDISAEENKIKVEINLFLNNENKIKRIVPNEIFAFNGSLAAYTPTTSVRMSYIFDIILDEIE